MLFLCLPAVVADAGGRQLESVAGTHGYRARRGLLRGVHPGLVPPGQPRLSISGKVLAVDLVALQALDRGRPFPLQIRRGNVLVGGAQHLVEAGAPRPVGRGDNQRRQRWQASVKADMDYPVQELAAEVGEQLSGPDRRLLHHPGGKVGVDDVAVAGPGHLFRNRDQASAHSAIACGKGIRTFRCGSRQVPGKVSMVLLSVVSAAAWGGSTDAKAAGPVQAPLRHHRQRVSGTEAWPRDPSRGGRRRRTRHER